MSDWPEAAFVEKWEDDLFTACLWPQVKEGEAREIRRYIPEPQAGGPPGVALAWAVQQATDDYYANRVRDAVAECDSAWAVRYAELDAAHEEAVAEIERLRHLVEIVERQRDTINEALIRPIVGPR